MIKIRRVEEKEPATCISYPCDGECSMSRALTEKARADAKKLGEPDAETITIQCPQIGSHYEQWRTDPATKEFSVSAVIARAAVDSGHFVEVAEQQVKLKSRQPQSQEEDAKPTRPLA